MTRVDITTVLEQQAYMLFYSQQPAGDNSTPVHPMSGSTPLLQKQMPASDVPSSQSCSTHSRQDSSTSPALEAMAKHMAGVDTTGMTYCNKGEEEEAGHLAEAMASSMRPLPVQPLPQLDGADSTESADDIDIKVNIQDVAAKVVSEWQQASVNELEQIERVLNAHAEQQWRALQPCVQPDATRDEAYRQIFAPFTSVQNLREELRRAKKGKTGRLTTVEELEAMSDVQLEPIRVLCNLQLVGECPPILKIGDVIPFLKDWRRTRPITCMDPIFKLVDAVIGRRLIQVLQEYGLLPEGTFGFIKGGAPDWPADLVSGVQWHARREKVAFKRSLTQRVHMIQSTTAESAQHVMCLPFPWTLRVGL